MGGEHIHVHVHTDEQFRFDLFKLEETLMATLEELKEEVRQTREVAAAGAALIRGLAAKIQELKDNPAALQELADGLNAAQEELGGAIAEQNPPEPEPTPEPTDPPSE